ncbi:MAG: magnesium/cobalt transporter CorA [Chitinophagaceae bacterium]|nr:magnesium/cobalt transporter CorA [Chitinophagaceae bacterium]
MAKNKYLRYLPLASLFGAPHSRVLFQYNPTLPSVREEAREVKVNVYDYDPTHYEEHRFNNVNECASFKNNNRITWINVDGLRKQDVETLCNDFGIHALLMEDILSEGQRPKMDDMEGILFCLLNMLYFNKTTGTVETEQISIAFGTDFVISFQEDGTRDLFDPLRNKLKMANSKIRQKTTDYLCYALLDLIVDNYFIVIENLGERIEWVEEEVMHNSNSRSLAHLTQLRKELIVLKRNIAPVRELINSIIRSDSDLLEDSTTKYFKDVYDHIVQAYDFTENYRDMMISMQDIYINNVNLRMNEVMKVMAIVTCLMAPATVIGGIFGMNFIDIPLLHNRWGFYISVGAMLLIPLLMLYFFRKRGWY